MKMSVSDSKLRLKDGEVRCPKQQAFVLAKFYGSNTKNYRAAQSLTNITRLFILLLYLSVSWHVDKSMPGVKHAHNKGHENSLVKYVDVSQYSTDKRMSRKLITQYN